MRIAYALLLLLISCGESPVNDALTQDIGAVGTLSVTVHYIGQAAPSLTVSLDASGDTYAQTDASGIAVFSNVAAGNHDIHVLDHQGAWISFYEVSGSQVFVDLVRPDLSYINIAGSLNNQTANSNNIKALFQSDNTTSFVGDSVVTGASHVGSISLPQVASGISLSGDLFLFEEQTIANTTTVVDVQSFLGQTLTSQSTTSSAVQTINLSFNVAKPATTSFATINNASPPAGITLDRIAAQYAPPIYGKSADVFSQSSPTFPYNIQAYDAPNLATNNTYIRLQGNAANHTWESIEQRVKGASTTLSSQFLSLPAINTGQTGNISFTSATASTSIVGSYTNHIITISDSSTNSILWKIILPPHANQISLPTLPSHITPNISGGSSYDITLSAQILGTYTYQQMVAENFSSLNAMPTPWEIVSTNPVTYTR